jgi:hypothetical protein
LFKPPSAPTARKMSPHLLGLPARSLGRYDLASVPFKEYFPSGGVFEMYFVVIKDPSFKVHLDYKAYNLTTVRHITNKFCSLLYLLMP